MKKNLLFVFTMLFALSFFTACSDDDNSDSEVPVLLKGETAFSAEKLSLKYGDSPLLGKAITFSRPLPPENMWHRHPISRLPC